MAPPTRILHVIDSFDLGGAQEALVNLIAHTDRARFAPEVATLHGRGIFWERFRALGVPVHSLSPHKFLPLYILRLARLLRARRFGIVHCHLLAANLIAKPLAALLGVKIRFNHDQANDANRRESRLIRALDAAANRLSTHICAVSQSIVNFLVEQENVPRERVSLVYNAIDLLRFTPPPERRANLAPVIAGVGRLNAQKNFALFLEVAAEVLRTHPSAQFVIAGIGPDEGALKQRAQELGIASSVRFPGLVPDAAQLFSTVDFLLMPSCFEGLPMALLEAMAMRVPIVASRLDGIAEVLENGVDGLLVEPGNSAAFAAALRTLLDDPTKARSLADAASIKVRSRFAAERMAHEVEALYTRYLP